MLKKMLDEYYPKRRKIDYEDDMVIVIRVNPNGLENVYVGLEDYEPSKNENWIWDNYLRAYICENYCKVCMGSVA